MRRDWKALIPRLGETASEQRVHIDAPEAETVLGQALYQLSAPLVHRADAIILLCIGTDRSIGDALGPLVGSFLHEWGCPLGAVHGTLDAPVHASNLVETLDGIRSSHRNPFIVAVDACLGRPESVGMITVGKGSLKPGAGVNKALPEVGDLYVTGVVNVGGFMEYFVLQNTRLSFVVKLAKATARGVLHGLETLQGLRPDMTKLRNRPPV